eukprot:TRINITY_DN90771_c0_g1_i1.p1 TRINITY_DN90771_c0_g1~~TRINITY_DN90771_c0_g1_i1.p1  ORF type:complete len:587 (-),score=109.32 TRINITY_DN90771_c0_g1_i1:67-1782(-)
MGAQASMSSGSSTVRRGSLLFDRDGSMPAGYASSVASSAGEGMPTESTCGLCICKKGVECVDFSEEHRSTYRHPEGILMACQYGYKCFRKNLEHLKQFVHPGDRNYRLGMVHFPIVKKTGQRVLPEFVDLRTLFNFCDPDESGYLSKEEFLLAWNNLCILPEKVFGIDSESNKFMDVESAEGVWQEAVGERSHMTFAMFARWASASSIKLPVGIDVSSGLGAERSCRFQYNSGGSFSRTGRCPCTSFTPSKDHPSMCECGHKSSVHHSDIALMSPEEQEILTKMKALVTKSATASKRPSGLSLLRKSGFDMVVDKETLADLQRLLSETHKRDSDNWTRDRGCALHGRFNCEDACIFRNKAAVPKGYELVRAEKNRNPLLWQNYVVTRAAMKQEISLGGPEAYQHQELFSNMEVHGEEPLDAGINEWRTLHGANIKACKGICDSNFRLKLAGTGATWKVDGKTSGKPLYGYGVYLAERSTKSDEYAEEIREGLNIDIGCHAMLVVRAVGGLCRVVDTNEFDTDDLKRDVLDGPYHSVLGDRTVKLGKPFREVVVYDSSQLFPEFILYYKRKF